MTVLTGDCLELMPTLPAESIDAIVTDPPYGLEFMGKEWDRLDWRDGGGFSKPGIGDRPTAWTSYGGETANPTCATCGGRKRGARKCGCESPDWRVKGEVMTDRTANRSRAMQDWHYRWAVEALRVAKPGAHLLAFGGTRTYHRLACAIEDAGWEVRDCLVWAYASGFPKSLDVSKAMDKAAGATRPIVRERNWHDPMDTPYRTHYGGDGPEGQPPVNVTAPATPDAVKWQGWGTALKPAWEPIILARKPLRGTVAANVTEYGTGALNIDATRIAAPENVGITWTRGGNQSGASLTTNTTGAHEYVPANRLGRWPANLVLTDPIFDGDVEGVVGGGEQSGGGNPPFRKAERISDGVTMGGGWQDHPTGKAPVDTSGTYSRFFLIPKAARSDREPINGMAKQDAGAETPMAGRGQGGFKCAKCNRWKVSGNPCVCPEPEFVQQPFDRPKRANHHPTVKPTELMRHLVRLVTHPGGVVLDPFLGSGTTAIACEMEGFGWIGIERDPEYAAIAEARLALVQRGLGL